MESMEYGVLFCGGVTRVQADADTRTVMSDESYARARAERLHGQAVARTVSVITEYGPWLPIGKDNNPDRDLHQDPTALASLLLKHGIHIGTVAAILADLAKED